jgi:CRP-like cAMP-binding protein
MDTGRSRLSRTRLGAAVEQLATAGEWIVREGEVAEEMYIIRSGRVAISKEMGGERVHLGDLGPGDFFGEMAVLESLPRAADVQALEDTRLLVIGAGALLIRIRRDPTLAVEMLHKLSGRVRALDSRLAEALGANRGDTAPLV